MVNDKQGGSNKKYGEKDERKVLQRINRLGTWSCSRFFGTLGRFHIYIVIEILL